MTAVLLALISQLNSSVFTLIVILILALWVTWVVSGKLGEWRTKFEHQEKRLSGIEKLSDTVIELKTMTNLIYQQVNPNSPVRSSSPLSLTDTGKEIAEKIKADAIILKYISRLNKDVEVNNPKNAYDVQEISMSVVSEKLLAMLSEEELNLVKQEAFNRGLRIEDVMSVLGILLRNRILEEKHLPISDVDRFKK